MQAADALGVRPATIYAYVSRGVLQRTTTVTDAGQRVSLFDRDEVLALAVERSRPRAGVVATLIESEVTELDPRGRLSFRGHDVAELAEHTFEEATAVLWQQPHYVPWPSAPAAWAKAAARAADSAQVELPQDRVMLALMHAATADEHRDDLSHGHVLAVARGAIQLGVSAVGGRDGAPVAAELWRAFVGREPDESERRAIEAALIVLLDHELAASTLAARVAASTHADPWMSLLAGLASMRGPRHGAASRQATRLLRHWLETHSVPAVVSGFGHKVYERMDPRAEIILDRVCGIAPNLIEEIDELIVAVAREHSLLPNVDLGLAALAVAADLPEGATETLFMISRTAGFAAHILEEYPHGLRYRPRAVGSG